MTPSRQPAASTGRAAIIVVAIGLAATMAALHLEGNAAVDLLWRGMTMEAYQRIARAAVLCAGGLAAGAGLITAPSRAWRVRWLLWCLVAAAAHVLLVVNHVEAIHFLQYGLLAILLDVGLRSPVRAATLAALLGVGDECYQYFVLYADHPARGDAVYLDGNDMLLDAIGAALGAMLSAMRRAGQSGR